MFDWSKLFDISNLVIPIITAIFGGVTTLAFTKLRKRSEEVSVTGVEHDTVKRISQSSIETIERLNEFVEEMSDKVLKQRQDFSAKIQLLTDEINALSDIITLQNQELKKMKEMIIDLTNQNQALIQINESLQSATDEFNSKIKE